MTLGWKVVITKSLGIHNSNSNRLIMMIMVIVPLIMV